MPLAHDVSLANMLDQRRLRTLCEVGRHGSFSQAAATLSYTHSAVSQQIASLERELGAPLVIRGPRGARLTDAGRLLVDRCTDIFRQLERAEADARILAGVRNEQLRVVAFTSVAASILPVAVSDFRHAYPHVKLNLVDGDPLTAMEQLRAGQADLAIVLSDSALQIVQGGEQVVTLLNEPMQLVLATNHRFAHRRTVRLAELADEDWISNHAPTYRHFLQSACGGAGFEPRVAVDTDDLATALKLIASGVGLALLPRLALEHATGVAICRIKPRLERQIDAVLSHDASGSPVARAFVEALRRSSATVPQPERMRAATPHPTM